MSQLALEMVSAGYGRVRVLEDVSMELRRGETLAILGPNGSGKSTLIKTIMGFTSLYGGRIVWNNHDITRLSVHDRAGAGLAYVPQTDNVFSRLSVLENLSLGAYLLPPKEVQHELAHVFQLFPILHERRGGRAGSLSGGEKKMLSLATALMMRPRCLLLDEPTTDLAPTAIAGIFDKIRAAATEYQVPVLLVEQNVRRALEIADRVCVLIRGQKKLDRMVGSVSEDELGELFLQA